MHYLKQRQFWDSFSQTLRVHFLGIPILLSGIHSFTVKRTGVLYLGESQHLVNNIKVVAIAEFSTPLLAVVRSDCGEFTFPYWVDHTIQKGTTTLEAILLLQWATRSQCLNLARYLVSRMGNEYSSALFTLRSARIVWREKEGKGEPWNRNHLSLHCTIDTQLWTAEGTEQSGQKN